MPVPKYDELFEPLLKAMHQLGGSALCRSKRRPLLKFFV
jgi:hypothetical protein